MSLDKKDKNLTPHEQSKKTITLSLNENVLDEIKSEAFKNGTSVSNLVTKILSKHDVIYKFAKDYDSIFLTSETFKIVINEINENLLYEDFLNQILDFIPTMFYTKNIPQTLENLVKFALSEAALDAGIYNYFDHFVDNNGDHNLVMRHNFGLKWSRILGNGHTELIWRMLNLKTTLITLPSTVIIKVHDSQGIFNENFR